jgi:methylmalonyl-CoA carboxyltransferase small subunit
LKLNITVDGKKYEVEVDLPQAEPRLSGYVPPYAPAERVSVPSAPAPAAAAPAPAAAPVGDESKVCRSPMAGIVVRVNTKPGQQIQVNDLLLVLEAMKMETNVTAPVSGKIKSIDVKPGDPVQVSQVLVQFE